MDHNTRWEPIAGHANYAISDGGDILWIGKSKQGVRIGHYLSSNRTSGSGYRTCMLYEENKKPVSRSIHRLVALHFLDTSDPVRNVVNHKNGNKLDNRSDNLEWVTPRENNDHSIKTGLSAHGVRHGSKTRPDSVPRGLNHWAKKNPERIPRGDKHHGTKLPDSRLEEVFYLRSKGLTQVEIGSCVGLSGGHVCNILSGRARAKKI